LDKVSFELQQGEFLTIIGPNGAGKSSLIKVLLGLIKADSGNIKRAKKLNALKRLQNQYPEAKLIAIFDAKGKNHRHEIYPQYKAHRKPADEELVMGEFLTIIGPNGAGKSSLIKVLLGLIKADSGNIKRAKQLNHHPIGLLRVNPASF
jgi:ABC-type Mn2+/Zn2+ transport system ATPase subunit